MLSVQRYILTGPLAGQTKQLGNFKFVRGVCEIRGSEEDHRYLRRYLKRNWQALPERDANKEHNAHQIQASPDRQADRPSVPHSGGQEPPTPGPAHAVEQPEAQTDRPAETTQSAPSDGHGHDDALNAKYERIRAALGVLDPTVSDHWTTQGKARVAVIKDLLDNEHVTAADIEAAYPGFRRPGQEEDNAHVQEQQ